jgi:hypothetical protein
LLRSPNSACEQGCRGRNEHHDEHQEAERGDGLCHQDEHAPNRDQEHDAGRGDKQHARSSNEGLVRRVKCLRECGEPIMYRPAC